MNLDKKPMRWPITDETLRRSRLLASREESRGGAVPNGSPPEAPLFKCDPRAVRIAFWSCYVLLAVLVCALIARVWGFV